MIEENNNVKHRSFIVSINLFWFSFYSNTRAFTIKNTATLIILSFWYSLISALLGWWGLSITRPFRSIRNTLEALHHNLTGGIDYTKQIDDFDYSDITNFVWDNLLRETKERIDKETVDIIIDIQDDFVASHADKYDDENLNFIILNLGKIDIHSVSRDDIRDVFDALKQYDKLS